MLKKFILLSVLLIYTPSLAQDLFKPPFKVKFVSPPSLYYYSIMNELKHCGNEGVKFLAFDLIKNFKTNTIVFLNNNGGIIDAVNAPEGSYFLREIFNYDFDGDKDDEFILCKEDKSKFTFVYVDFINGVAMQREVFYLKKYNNHTNIKLNYLIVKNKKKFMLIILISTIYPKKHEYRQILALDARTFKLLWRKVTADYIFSILYDKEKQPDYFYYTTISYFNGLSFSNNTFYKTKMYVDRKHANNSEYIYYIDTAFTKKQFPLPDSTAKDYSTDSKSYLVKMDLNGNYVYRKKLGEKFVNTRFFYDKKMENLLVEVIYRNDVSGKIFKFDLSKDKLNLLFKINAQILRTFFRKKEVVVVVKGKIIIYSLTSGEIDTLNIDRNISKIEGTENYFQYPTEDGKYINICDSTFTNILAKVKVGNNEGKILRYSNELKIFQLQKGGKTLKFFQLEKVPFYKRLTDKALELIIWILFCLIIILLANWIYLLLSTGKKIKMQNKELLQTNKELERATSSLIRAERLAVLGTIAGAVAHQLNSPLMAIMNSAERLEEKLRDDENLILINKASVKIKKIVERFLTATRLDEKSLTESSSNLDDILKEFRELFGNQFNVLGIEFKFEIELKCKVKIPSDELSEVITNIIFNAKDAILEANKEKKQIIVEAKKVNDACQITVSDTGVGFNDVILSNPFEPFFSTKEKGKGTGLGMWIVNRLVRKNGGTVDFGNTSQGAYVRITLPIA